MATLAFVSRVLGADPQAPLDPHGSDYAARALVRAVEGRRHAGGEVDRALSLFVRRARAEDEPIERMLATLKGLLLGVVRPLHVDERAADVIAVLMRRAITEYYR